MSANLLSKVVDDAISRSISHGEIVTIPYSAETFDAHLCDLLDVSEDSVDAGEVVEFWGCRGTDDWRVHLLTGGSS